MVSMEMNAVSLSIDERKIVSGLEKAAENLGGDQQELTLDFSSVRRIDSDGLLAIEEFAQKADDKKVKVVLRGVNIDLYKCLKLVRLTRRFSFVN
jgi:anti-anti-sigma regulatory factor